MNTSIVGIKRTRRSQQALKSAFFHLSPVFVILTFFILGFVVSILGVYLYTSAQNSTPFNYEQEYTSCPKDSICNYPIDVLQNVPGPVFLQYKIENFYQNHRIFKKSMSWRQLLGNNLSAAELEDECKPFHELNGKPIYPCGMRPNYMFSDEFRLKKNDSNALANIETATLVWPVEREVYGATKYAPKGFEQPLIWPLAFKNALTDQFIIWMRGAPFSSFKKPVGIIQAGLSQGQYTLEIRDNFYANDFGSKKYFILTNVTDEPGRKLMAYFCFGFSVILILTSFWLLLKHVFTKKRSKSFASN